MRFRILLISLLLLTLLAGCAAQPEATDFFTASSPLPGVRLTLATPAPPRFQQADLETVRFYNAQGEDVWLHAPAETLAARDADGAFRAWLEELGAVRFQTDAGDVYWIPGDKTLEALPAIDGNGLDRWADPQQLARAWRQRGDAVRAAKQYKLVLPAYERAVELAPDDVYLRLKLADWLWRSKKFDEALEHAYTALEMDPNNPRVHRTLGDIYVAQQRFDLAVGPLTHAYLLDPSMADALIGIAVGIGRNGDPQLALKILEKAEKAITNEKKLEDIQTLKEEFSSQNP
jgi:tetratricopeptide (TPR) repeat protein